MKVAITGASGLVGSALTGALTARGDEVVRYVRREPRLQSGESHWDPEAGVLDRSGFEGCQAVVHLAGENIGARRWNPAQKRRLVESRVKGTAMLAGALASMDAGPRVLVCASAVGFYGDRGDEVVNEDSTVGGGFLAELVRQWEQASKPAVDAGLRVVWLRFGVVLSGQGGALAKMLTPFRLGLGGVIGNGRQFMPWVAREDAVGIVMHALDHDDLRGPVNAVAPAAVTNREFTRTLGRVLGRPTVLPMPAFAARLAFGEMADELLLSGQRVEPRVLKASGYSYQFAELESALRRAVNE